MSENYGTNVPLKTDPTRVIEVKILNALNSGAGSMSINYPGPPTVTPPAIAAIVVDSNGRQWQYFQGAWH